MDWLKFKYRNDEKETWYRILKVEKYTKNDQFGVNIFTGFTTSKGNPQAIRLSGDDAEKFWDKFSSSISESNIVELEIDRPESKVRSRQR